MEADPTSDLARPGIVVANRYRLDTVVGRGGMGSVWSAVHIGLGHRVAIKLISREFVRSPEALRRFDAEAKAAVGLQSRHVVQVYDNGTLDDGTPYIAMELLSGESLQARIEGRGRIELRESVEILAQCCKALARAHTCGIVHRDIKPDNVFLARMPDEDGDVVKILDFGVAKVLPGQGRESDQGATGTGTLLGTPLYMSPEQVRGLKSVDARADVYSLGLTAFTMLTGQLAVNAETFGEVLLKICVEPLPSLCAAAPWLPPTMEAWFQRVCAREPAERCPSAQEFIETLRVAAAGPAVGRPVDQSGANLAPRAIAPTLVASGVNMTITAAGVPRRAVGVWVVAGALGLLAILAVALLFAMRPKPNDAPATAVALPDRPTDSVAASASPPPAPVPALSVAGRGPVNAGTPSALSASPPVRVAGPVAPHFQGAGEAPHEGAASQAPMAHPIPSAAPPPAAPVAPVPQAPVNSPTTKPINLGY